MMPNFQFDHSTKVITIDFTDAEYKALSWQEEDPFAGIKQRVEAKVEVAWTEAVREEMRLHIADPNTATMPANEEQLIMQSTRPSYKEVREQLIALDETSIAKEGDGKLNDYPEFNQRNSN